MLKLYVGNKKYSSWSMRPWLALKSTGVPFDQEVIALDMPDTAEQIARFNPAGRVPCLIDGELVVWDSLAICEYLAEKFPDKRLWPQEAAARATARSACAEMHSGFQALRNDLPMKIREPLAERPLRDEVKAEVARIVGLWADCRRRFGKGGPFLFGEFGIADAYYAPVSVGRFRTYSVPIDRATKDYIDAVYAHPAVQAWVADAGREQIRARRYETETDEK
jgi:glutathione S-transferase